MEPEQARVRVHVCACVPVSVSPSLEGPCGTARPASEARAACHAGGALCRQLRTPLPTALVADGGVWSCAQSWEEGPVCHGLLRLLFCVADQSRRSWWSVQG